MEEKHLVEMYQCTYAQYREHLENQNQKEDDDNSSSDKNQIPKEDKQS